MQKWSGTTVSSNSEPTPIPESDYHTFKYWTSYKDGLDCPECGEYLCRDPNHLPVPMFKCSACKGTGMDRWEEDYCNECWGEGELPAS